mmetsp:Transcript_10530/g.33357  ORF Transcript_10530/g.33357 Transcript_10530/m.33357 type:complete len:358 (-) Transcript_10530:107-1180(-)
MVDGGINNCVPAAGPMFAAACLNRFVPASAQFAAIEYTANMAFSAAVDDDVDYRALETLVRRLHSQAANVVFVNVLPVTIPGRPAVAKYEATLIANHRAALELAERFGFPTITVNRTTQPQLFTPSNPHLNDAGHRHVHDELMRHFTQATRIRPIPSNADKPIRAHRDLQTSCQLGDELRRSLMQPVGFKRIELASDKVAWEARQQGASVGLCIDPPRGVRRYVIALGFQISHRLNLPLFGTATVRCEGGCECAEQRIDTLGRKHGVTVTEFLKFQAVRRHTFNGKLPGHAVFDSTSRAEGAKRCSPSQCTVLVANSREGTEPCRIILRALITGPASQTGFLGRWAASQVGSHTNWR